MAKRRVEAPGREETKVLQPARGTSQFIGLGNRQLLESILGTLANFGHGFAGFARQLDRIEEELCEHCERAGEAGGDPAVGGRTDTGLTEEDREYLQGK